MKIRTIIGMAVLLGFFWSAKAQIINTEAVNRYWALTDSLKKDRPLTDRQWQEFLSIEGNKTYAASEFDSARLARYRKALEIVYRPSNDSLLQARLKANDWYVILAKRYKDEEPALKADLRDTLQNPVYFNRAYQYVYEYLPQKWQHHVSNLVIYYNCLSNDAVSYTNGLFFSLLSVTDNAKTRKGTLEAHELHHRLRQERDILLHQATKNSGLLWAIRNIPNEGIADLIDKTWEKPEDIYDWLIAPAPATIASLDSCIRVLASHADSSQNERFYRNLLRRTTGHMPGFYMARVIVHNGYKQRLIDGSDNPFNFFYLYNRVAKKDKTKPVRFSEQSMAYLKHLERICSQRTD
ncbi:MAG TPA: DUF5700 domain-containing putative Zn-dependent protease [Mucilaginibacter sp.]|nr:DUF5700 domain-containing putative Zn-dependent protease [Mucilaginibacter sp.]